MLRYRDPCPPHRTDLKERILKPVYRIHAADTTRTGEHGRVADVD